jgi:hypothetical protein
LAGADTVAGVSIEERLAAAAAALLEYRAAQAQLADVHTEIAAAREYAANLAEELDEEERDVQRLESLSFTRVLSALRRSREDDLDRERAERDAARCRLGEAEYCVSVLDGERERIEHRLSELASAQQEWNAALAAKEAALAERGAPQSAELFGIAQERGEVRAAQREVLEALDAAVAAEAALTAVAAHLREANGWSIYDTFLGGKGLSSALKYDKIDAAQRAATAASTRLAVLARELRDVGAGGPVAPTLKIGTLTSLADIFFDNIFTDWAVDTRIVRAQESVAQSRKAVGVVTQRLRGRERELTARAARLAQRRVDVIHTA